MKIAASVAELQRKNIVLELESIDRMYLNAYVPKLTSEKAIAGYFRGFLGHRFASRKSAAGKSESFVREMMKFIRGEKIALVCFETCSGRPKKAAAPRLWKPSLKHWWLTVERLNRSNSSAGI